MYPDQLTESSEDNDCRPLGEKQWVGVWSSVGRSVEQLRKQERQIDVWHLVGRAASQLRREAIWTSLLGHP